MTPVLFCLFLFSCLFNILRVRERYDHFPLDHLLFITVLFWGTGLQVDQTCLKPFM